MPRRGQVATILTDHDDAWVDQQDELHWIRRGHGDFSGSANATAGGISTGVARERQAAR